MVKRTNRVAWGLVGVLAVASVVAMAVGAVVGIIAGNLTHYAYWTWRVPGAVVYSNGVWIEYGLDVINSHSFFLWGGLLLGTGCGCLLGVWLMQRRLTS